MCLFMVVSIRSTAKVKITKKPVINLQAFLIYNDISIKNNH